MENKGRLYFTIGLSRCGKTTFAEEWGNQERNRIVLEQDHFRISTYGIRFRLEGEELARGAFITAIRACLLKGYDVLAVDTHSGYWNVNQLLMIDPNAKAYIFHTPKEVCIQRAIETNQPDLVSSIERMWSNLLITLPRITHGQIILKDFEEFGPEFRWIRNGYWR